MSTENDIAAIGQGASVSTNIGEIRITKYIGSWGPPPPDPVNHPDRYYRIDPSDRVSMAQIIAEINACREHKCSALLVSIETRGGVQSEALAVYHELRRFSREVGPVIVFVSGWCASSGPIVALAGDYIVMDCAAMFGIHSCYGGSSDADGNKVMLQVLEARTETPRPWIEKALSYRPFGDGPEIAMVDPSDATATDMGWADVIGDAAAARLVAETATASCWRSRFARRELGDVRAHPEVAPRARTRRRRATDSGRFAVPPSRARRCSRRTRPRRQSSIQALREDQRCTICGRMLQAKRTRRTAQT